MPLTETGKSWLSQLRAAYPGASGLSDTELLTLYLEGQGKHEHKDNPLTPEFEDDPEVWKQKQAKLAGLPTGGSIHSLVAGALDGLNPTPWGRMETRIGDSSGLRTAGNLAGTLGTFAVAPLAGAKIAKAVGLGAKTAMGIDLGLRGAVGASGGFHDIQELAAGSGKPLDTQAAVEAALSGAGAMMMPLDFAPKGVTSTIGRKAFNSLGMTGAGALAMGGTMKAMSDQLGVDPGDLAKAAWENGKHDPRMIGTMGAMAVAPWLMKPSENGFHFSTAGDAFKKMVQDVRQKTTPSAMGSTSLARGTGPDVSAIPPRPSPLDTAGQNAIANALSPEGMDFSGIMASHPRTQAESGALRDHLDMLARLKNTQDALGGDTKTSLYANDIYTDPIPGMFDTRQRVWGTAGADALVGPDLQHATAISSGDLWKLQQVLHQGERNFVLGPGYQPLSSGHTFPDMLPESLATQMGVPRKVSIFGQHTQDPNFLVAPEGVDRFYPVPGEALPGYSAQQKAWEAQRAADELASGIRGEMGASAERSGPRVGEADPVAIITKIRAELEEMMKQHAARNPGTISITGLE